MNCAILVIGSLLWGDGPKEAWRQDRLRVPDRQSVHAPIRYGRRSTTWANTFTMVLDPAVPAGRAFLVPSIREVETIEDLVDEAEALWRAERNATTGSGICAEWGCVGALFRGDLDDARVMNGWSQHFRSACAPTAPVHQDGILGIAWPVSMTDGAPVVADVILAAATQAEASRPSPSQIADAWIEQNNGKERYFFQNVQSGIRTADDQAIAQRLIARAPAWIGSETYASALEQLSTNPRARSPRTPGDCGTLEP